MKTSVSILFLVFAVALLWLAGEQNRPLVQMRAIYHLDATEPLDNAPPAVAFTTVVLGGFRGILADVLWLRTAYLQEEGQYFELIQLADWITKLEPRCAEIWEFHAWNMAYNVSVMMSVPEDRWRWVRNGVHLLRDQGLRYNPGAPDLYWELGWIFQNKIGSRADLASGYYRKQWAGEMTDLLGGPRPDYAKLESDPEAGRRLRQEYKLDPDIMKQVDEVYGPLDWRLPDTHALYWAWQGKQYANVKTVLPCDRMIYQAMASTFMQGRLTYRPEDDTYETAPYPEILPNVLKAFDYAATKHTDESVRAAYVHFLQNAIYVLHAMNRDEEARRLFRQLTTQFSAYEIPTYEILISAPSTASLRRVPAGETEAP